MSPLYTRFKNACGTYSISIGTVSTYDDQAPLTCDGDLARTYYRPKTEEQEWVTQRDPVTLHGEWMMCLVCIDRGMKAHGASHLPPCQYGTWRRAKSLALGGKLIKACICPGTKTVGTSDATCLIWRRLPEKTPDAAGEKCPGKPRCAHLPVAALPCSCPRAQSRCVCPQGFFDPVAL